MVNYPHHRNPDFPNMVYVTDFTWEKMNRRIAYLETEVERLHGFTEPPEVDEDELWDVLKSMSK